MIDSQFKIICERCGVHFSAVPGHEFPNVVLPADSVTISTVEYCPFCVMRPMPVSHRARFLCHVVKELQELKAKVKADE